MGCAPHTWRAIEAGDRDRSIGRRQADLPPPERTALQGALKRRVMQAGAGGTLVERDAEAQSLFLIEVGGVSPLRKREAE
jgi:hypothetical protein